MLLWCLKFMNLKRFNILFSDWICCLQTLVCVKQNKFTLILLRLLKSELEFGSLRLEKIFKNYKKIDIFPIFFNLRKARVSRECYNRYLHFANKTSHRDIYEGDYSFRKNDYDDLWQSMTYYFFLNMAIPKNPKVNFPPNKLKQYQQKLKTFNFEILDQQKNKDTHDLDYFATHVAFFNNCYGCCKKKSMGNLELSAEKYLISKTKRILSRSHDVDLIGETLDAMLIFNNKKWLRCWKSKFVNYIISRQKKDGSVTRITDDMDLYDKFHGVWGCISSLYYLID